MGRHAAKRLLVSGPLLLLVVTAIFWAFQFIPGDPAQLYVGFDASRDTVEEVRRDLGLDKASWVQYLAYLQRLMRGDLGRSITTRRPVTQELAPRILATLKLSLASIVVAGTFGIALGSVAAARQRRIWDHFVRLITLVGISVPVFWLGLMLSSLLSIKLRLLPSAGMGTWRHYLMPTVCLAVFSLAFIARMTRSSLLDVIREDYIRTAQAKGVHEVRVIYWHALRNALVPILIVVGLRFGYMLGGAVVTEAVFAWPGLGQTLVTSVGQRDIPMVQGVLLFFAASFVLVNLAVDLLYGLLDPRIRYQR